MNRKPIRVFLFVLLAALVAVAVLLVAGVKWWREGSSLLGRWPDIGEGFRAIAVCEPDDDGILHYQVRVLRVGIEQARLTLFPTIDTRVDCYSSSFAIREIGLSHDRQILTLRFDSGVLRLPVVLGHTRPSQYPPEYFEPADAANP